jgi:two-component system, NtrC family, nitrogen regulation sensor histidine kinase NtrY
MAFRRFALVVTLQVLLIVLVCAVAAYLLTATPYHATTALTLFVLAAQIVVLLHFVQRTNRELSRFLLVIQHGDLSQSFSTPTGSGTFAQLGQSFEGVMQRFRESRIAREEEASYLNTLVHHVPIAVLAVDESGRIDLFNRAARALFGVQQLRNLRDFDGFGEDFPQNILALQAGDEKLLKVVRAGETLQLTVSAASIAMRGRELKIVSLQDIRRELEVRELKAWQNLIRVLTHEIMNSVTPMSSLASTARDLLDDAAKGGDFEGTIKDVHDALDTIAQRGNGLLHFVESYRRLTRLPIPRPQRFSVGELFSRVGQLMATELEQRSIALKQSVAPDSASLTADGVLVEQAVINVVKNAVDAIGSAEAGAAETGRVIVLSSELDAAGRLVISVTDNGAGMDEQILENIFVPFYTTKREGTGIGLSVVQQIMRSHHGSVAVASAPGKGTSVRLLF